MRAREYSRKLKIPSGLREYFLEDNQNSDLRRADELLILIREADINAVGCVSGCENLRSMSICNVFMTSSIDAVVDA